MCQEPAPGLKKGREMPPASGSQKDLSTLPPIFTDDHEWALGRTSYDGAPLIVRFNTSAGEWVGHKELSIKLGFAVPLNSPNEGGLPNPDEGEQLNAIEDVIVQECDTRAKGIYVLALTTGIMREFIFYIAAGADFGAIHDAITGAVTTHEVQCMAVKDHAWNAYTQFVEAG